MTEEFVRYLEMCVNFHHKNDESFKITDSAYAKENLMYFKAIHYINELYSDVKENHTIEQNTGESQIEGGVVSISGSVEKHYRPFKDCSELIKHYQEKYKSEVGCNIYFPSLYKPNIWLKRNEHTRDILMNRTFLITGYEDSGVVVDNKWIGMDELLEKYKFLDDSPVGKLEE